MTAPDLLEALARSLGTVCRHPGRQCERCGRFYRPVPRLGEHPEGIDPDLCPSHLLEQNGGKA